MLHWLAGKTAPDTVAGAEDAGYFDPPETPAPVFAVRAFKQAIFGTPQTTNNKAPRRNSSTETHRPRLRTSADGSLARPHLPRPKSSSDPRSLFNETRKPCLDVPQSPTKGILLTPGTAATRRKTVTFGEGVIDADGTCLNRSGLPDDCPGKFPSPWTKPNSDFRDESDLLISAGSRKRLTDAFVQARNEATSELRNTGKLRNDDEFETECAPSLECSDAQLTTYWKAQYDIYRTNTQKEVKKLILKSKAAKSFAAQIESENTELMIQLADEKAKVLELERKSMDLESQLRAYLEVIQKLQQRDSQKPFSAGDIVSSGTNDKMASRASLAPELRLTRGASTNEQLVTKMTAIATAKFESANDDGKDSQMTKQSSRSRRPRVTVRASKDDTIEQGSRRQHDVTDNTRALAVTYTTAPLTLTGNHLSSRQLKRRDSAQMLQPSGTAAEEVEQCQNLVTAAGTDALIRDPHTEVISNRPLSPSRRSANRTRTRSDRTEAVIKGAAAEDQTRQPVPADDMHAAMKPSTAWTMMSGTGAANGRRSTTVVDRSGKEVAVERLEAARQRLLARGRDVS